MTSTLFVEEIKGRTTGTNANKVIVPSGQALTVGGAFTSPGIDDNADAITITLDANEDITASNGMYVSGDLTSLTVDKGGIDRSGNTTRIISGRSGGNYADFSVNIAGVGGVNRQLYMDYQGNTTLDNGNLKFGTAGKGIDFSASADGAGSGINEVLTDYEHGTWTPTAQGGQTIGTIYSAFYQKIGQMVYVGTYFTTTATPNNSGMWYFGGLPFAVATGGHYHSAGAITYIHNFNNSSLGMLPPTPYSGGGTTFYFHRDSGSATTVLNSDVQGFSHLIVGFWYYTTA